ncbi:MAG: DNA-binding protein [Methylobacter sp.]|nr:MAG: DNA-binding protein [Methylobacter sp.]
MSLPTPKKKPLLTRGEALDEFERAPDTALFNQTVIAHIRDCTVATLERDRWAGGGIPFLKIGRAVKYRKSDVMAWLDKHKPRFSTSESVVGASQTRQ